MTFSGGEYEEVGRWLKNFAAAHAKRESPRVEAVVESEGERERRSYGLRLRLGERRLPPPGETPLELAYPEVAQRRGSLEWCAELAERVRTLARRLVEQERGARKSA
jgi:hypothetical protein